MAHSTEFGIKRDTAPGAAPPTIHEQQRFWDWHWQHWQDRRAINEWALHRGERVLNMLRGLALDRPRILDMGCGIGWFSHDFSRFGDVTGIDLSEEAIAKARARYPHITFRTGNVLSEALPAGHFDVGVSQEVLAHVDDQAMFVRAAATVLRPGGYLILTTVNRIVVDRLGTAAWEPWPREHIEHYLDMKDLKRLLRPHFRVRQATTVLPLGDAGILRLINSHKLNKTLSRLIPQRSLDALKERAGFGYFLLVLAQKRA